MNQVARVAGSDTREALTTPTVRAMAAAAALASAPGWLCAFGAPTAWKRYFAMPSSAAPWFAMFLAATGVLAALAAWKWAMDPLERARSERLMPGLGGVAVLVLGAFIVVGTRDGRIMAIAVCAAPAVSGWIVGTAARTSVAASVPVVESAAAGVVIAGGLTGLILAGHLALVTRGSGFPRAAGWCVAYGVLACINLIRAARFLERDRSRIAARIDVGDAPTANKTTAALALDSIVVKFGSTTILHGVSVDAVPGELIALVGGNGAGKSTLLRTAAGFIAPHSGRIVVNGDDVTTLLPEERAAAGLAFVSGARPIFPDLTVLENLRVAAYRSHPTSRLFHAATDSVLELVPALAKRQKSKAGVLSGGEQRLLAVAQTLFRRPAALLADELTLGLDVESRLAVLDLLRLLADEGIAVVVVDHDLPSLLPRSHRAVLLAHGEAKIFAKPEDVLEQRSDLLPATFLSGASA